jgi:hypothetical protein
MSIENIDHFNHDNFSNIYETDSINDFYNNNELQNLNIIPINYFEKSCFEINCEKKYIIKDFKIIYDMVLCLPLTNLEKNLILVRFRRINLFCLKNFKNISFFYVKSKLFIIICGILNPSLLSINTDYTSKYYIVLFWLVWSLQLSVSIVTSFISFYKWDKKYFLYSSYKSRINQEIWLYLGLTGKYNKECIENEGNIKKLIEPNHKNKLNFFLNNIENLLKKLKDFDLEIETNENDNNEQINRTKVYKNRQLKIKEKKNKDENDSIESKDDDNNQTTIPSDDHIL